ncbi:hypothetical protein LCGC14_0244020 [marine sediment metagenome]|uniref:Uncharacterized protein n=1 Tax=marine sediment metagenome TaxID=412755 RepID=A0A0F9U6I1_9ZZZZ
MSDDNFTLSPLPDFGDHFTKEEFSSILESGAIIDSDGIAYYATATHKTSIEFLPSDFKQGKNRGEFTHVIWYNK